MEQKSDHTNAETTRARSESPTSKCPICLSLIDNPAFTDICIHQFCFTCLCEWAKVKAVCPVCKQDFLSIAYNVQSYEKFDELPVKNLTIQDAGTRFPDTGFQLNALLSHRVSQIHGHPQDARFRYRTTMTSDYRDVLRRLEEQRLTEELCNPLVRVTVNHRPFVFSSNARKAVYRTGLRVQHLQTATEQVFSLIKPQFFNENPACKIRLSPWLQRELDVLAELSDTPGIGDTMLLINLIFTLLNTLKITSQNFYNRLYPYLRRYTLHFLQELYCFACSAPHTMPQYDSCVVYGEGTSGAIWSVWHRDRTQSNSGITTTAIHDAIREEDIIQIPSERGFISFFMNRHGRNANQSSAIPVQGTSLMRATTHGAIDLVQEPSDSSSDVEVVGQEPPWDARMPILISDSDEESTDREQRVESRLDREQQNPVSRTPSEHDVQRTSMDPSPTSFSSVNEHRFYLSEGMLISLHNGHITQRENKSADDRRDISDTSEEENAGDRFKTKRQQTSSYDWENHRKRDHQNHAKELRSKDRKSLTNDSRMDRSGYSTDVRKYVESSNKEQSASTGRQRRYKHRSRERSKSYRSRHSKEPSREHRRSRSKERVRTSRRSPSREQSKVHRQSRSKEHDDYYSRRSHTEYREMHSSDRKPSSLELQSRSSEKLDRCVKERQPLQCPKRKRRNSGLTYRCDSSETDSFRLSSSRENNYGLGYVSSASDSHSFSLSIPTLSKAYRRIASCKPREDPERDRDLSLRTDSSSLTHSFNKTESDRFRSDVGPEDCKVDTEDRNLNDSSFVRKTYFWSDEEETSEDAVSCRSKTLRSQIGCMLFTGSCGVSSVLEPLSADEELIVIESSECSSSKRQRLPKDYDTNETSYSHKNKKGKHWSQSCTSSKKSHKKCEKDLRCVGIDSSTKEGSRCSLESHRSKKQWSRSEMSSGKHKKKRQDVDTDSRRQNRTTNHMDVGLARDRFDENADQHNVTYDIDDDGSSPNKSLNVVDEVTFKKHFTGHKNFHLKTTKH